MMLENAQRVLILEFINADQFPGQVNSSIPLVKGFLDFWGKRSRWLRFALPTDHFFRHNSDEVQLSSGEFGVVAEAVGGLSPDFVVTTHKLGSDLRSLLRQAVPEVEVATGDEVLWMQRPLSEFQSVDELLGSGAFAHAHELSRPGFAPGYRWEPGNAGASRQDRHNIYLITAHGCGYRKPVAANAFYSSLELPPHMTGGCAFCGARLPPETSAQGSGHKDVAETTPKAWITTQVAAVATTLAPDHLPNALILNDIERPEILEAAIEAMQRFGLSPGVRLLAGLRVDRLLQMESLLRATLGKGSQGPTLQVFSCGIENFSDEELGRLNKGTSCRMNLQAVNLLKDLETSLPGRFYYSGYKGLSVILFTPWTTLSDLHLNVGLIRHLQLEDEVGNLFLSRLRLHQDLAITFLARHDGAVIDEEEDDVLILNRRKLFAEELAWKHLAPGVEAVARLAVRLARDEHLAADPLYREVQRVLPEETGASRGNSVQRLLALVEAQVELPPGADHTQLLAKAREKMAGTRVSTKGPLWRAGERLMALPEFLKEAEAGLLSELTSTVSIPLAWPLAESRQRLDALGVALPHVVMEDPFRLSGQTARLVMAGTPEGLDQALDVLWKRAGSGVGDPGTWWHLNQLLARPDQWQELIRDLFRGALAGPGGAHTERAHAHVPVGQFLERLKPGSSRPRAMCFSLGSESCGEMVSFDVEAANETSLWYDPDSIEELPGDIRGLLRLGDRLFFRPGQVQVLKGTELLGLWTASVACWMQGRQWFPLEWTELSKAALRQADPREGQRRTLVSLLSRSLVADPTILRR